MKIQFIAGSGALLLCSIVAITGCSKVDTTSPGSTVTVNADGTCVSDGNMTKSPGSIAFTLKNDGEVPASVALTRDGSDAASIVDVAPGATSTTKRVTDVKEGTYTLTCKVGTKSTELETITTG